MEALGITGRYEKASSDLRNLWLAGGVIMGARKLCPESADLYRILPRMTVFDRCRSRRMRIIHALISLSFSPPVTLTSARTIFHTKVRAARRHGKASTLLGSFRVRLGVGLGGGEGEEGEEDGLGRVRKAGGGAGGGAFEGWRGECLIRSKD